MRSLCLLTVALFVTACTAAAAPRSATPAESDATGRPSVAAPSSAAALPSAAAAITDVVVARVDSLPARPNVEVVKFADAVHGWLGGDGVILATSDAGATWHEQLRTPGRVVAFDFVDAGTGWATIADGSLVRTRDGGATWQVLGPKGVAEVDFIGPLVGWATALGAHEVGVRPATTTTLLRTDDGGETWRPAPGSSQAHSVCFANPSAGWASGDTAVRRTVDGGRSWATVLRAPLSSQESWFATVRCAGQADAWVQFSGSSGGMSHKPYVVYRTGDGGSTWTVVFAEGYSGSLYPGIQARSGPGSYPSIFGAIDPWSAFFLGWYPETVSVAVTVDGGATFTGEGSASFVTGIALPAILSPRSADFTDASHGWVVGAFLTETRVLRTIDGGRSWTIVYPSSADVPVRGVSFIDRDNGWALGNASDSTAIMRTRDGGAHWSRLGCLPPATSDCATGRPSYFRQSRPPLAFADADHGWALGGDGMLYSTVNGGRSWAEVDVPVTPKPGREADIIGVAFTDPRNGFALADGDVLRTRDGGRTWDPLGLPGDRPQAIACGGVICWVVRGTHPADLLRFVPHVGSVSVFLPDEIAVNAAPAGIVSMGAAAAWTLSQWVGQACRDFGLQSCYRLLKLDAGRWIEYRIPIEGSFDPVVWFVDSETGWLGTGTRLYRTDDGGRTWRELIAR